MANDDGEPADVVVLPRSAEKLDHTRVDRAVRAIRGMLVDTVERGMEEVGTYLLREFYDDDPELCASMSRYKHVSLSALAERCESIDFPVSRGFLWKALKSTTMLRLLPKSASFRKLPESHRVELLSLREPDRVEALAARAVERELSRNKLRVLVQKEKEKAGSSGRGRRPTPTVLKALGACVKLLRDEATGKLAFHRADVQELDEEQVERARAELKILAKRVADLEQLFA